VEVTAPISGLTPSTTYHFDLVCANAGGFGQGGDQMFTTSSSSSPPSTLSRLLLTRSKGLVGKLRRVKFRVICGTNVSCTGNLTLHGPGGRKFAPAVPYFIGAGGDRIITMTLNKPTFARLKKAKHHRIIAITQARDNDGVFVRKTVTLILV
jgi:hypothetical protein